MTRVEGGRPHVRLLPPAPYDWAKEQPAKDDPPPPPPTDD